MGTRTFPGPQVYFGRRRIHHGGVGVLLAAVGAILCWHDRHDASVWIKDFRLARERGR